MKRLVGFRDLAGNLFKVDFYDTYIECHIEEGNEDSDVLLNRSDVADLADELTQWLNKPIGGN